MGRNPDSNERARKHRRAQILSAALELFAANGLTATKVSDIAERAGMAQGLLYHYFSSKEQMYVDIVRTAFDKLNEACKSLERNTWLPDEKVSRALEALIGDLEENPDSARYHVLIAQAQLTAAIPSEARAIIDEQSVLPYQVFTRIMASGQTSGTIRSGDPAQFAAMFWMIIKGLALHQAVHGKKALLPDASIFHPLFFP